MSSDLDLTKPESWLVLAIGGAVLALVQYLMRKRAKATNKNLGLNLDEMTVPEIAKAWTKSVLMAGQHQGIVMLAVMIALIAVALVFALFESYIIALVVSVLSILIPLALVLYKPKTLNLMQLESNTFTEVKEYFKANKIQLLDEGLEDPEVIAAQEKWPGWLLKLNLKMFYAKGFYPKLNPSD